MPNTVRVYEVRREVTSAQIKNLRQAAHAVGADRLVSLCDRALTGEPAPRREVAALIERGRR